jgi:hypothetical protein
MGRVTERDAEIISKLVVDCNTYSLNERESLEYIKQRLGRPISGRTYRRYKTNLNYDEMTQAWINQYVKVGFLTTYKEIFDIIDIIQKDTLRDYFTENSKTYEVKNHARIQMYRNSLRENSKLLSDLGSGSPIIAQLKARIDEADNRLWEVKSNSSLVEADNGAWV